MTNQQGAPEALAHELFTAAQLAPGEGISDAVARIAALVDAQQPAPHVQKPAEIEHVAGDVSKNSAESNMAQQPAPSAAAVVDGRLIDEAAERMSAQEGYEKRIKRVSERNPHDEGMYSLGWWDRAWKAAEPSTTPQADSVTAPAGGANWAQLRSALAMLMLGWGRNPNQTMDACYRVLDSATEPGTALAILRTAPDWRDFMAADRAKADSVLEDAARLDWIELAGPTSICRVIDRPHDGEVEVATDDVTGYGKTLRAAIDAARKQGGAT